MDDFALDGWDRPRHPVLWKCEAVVSRGGRDQRVRVALVNVAKPLAQVLYRLEEATDVLLCGASRAGTAQFFNHDVEKERVLEVVRENIVRNQRLRVFYLPDVGPPIRLWEGRAFWGGTPGTAFRLPHWIVSEPLCASWAVFEWLQSEHSKPDSELNFALKMCNMDALSRRQLLVEAFPALGKMQQLMTWVVQSESATTELGAECSWILGDDTATILQYRLEGQRAFDHIFRPDEVPPVFRAWSHFLRTYFPDPTVDESLPLCLHVPLKHAKSQLQAIVFTGSHHERLEARLRLREWLERNAPERLGELLPE